MSKRIGARVMVHRRVEYQHARGQGEGMLLDLSLQGCRIKGAPPFPTGTRLQLQLGLPDQAQPVKVERAAVRWIKDDEFGVSFLELTPDARIRVAQVVQLLHEAQQPEVRMTQIPAAVLLDSQQGSASRGVPKGYWQPPDDL